MTWDFGTVRKTLPQAPARAQPPPRTGPSAPIPLANNVRSHDYAARPQANGATPAFVQPAFQTVRREPEPAPAQPASSAQHVATPSDDSADDDQSILDSVVLPALDGVRVGVVSQQADDLQLAGRFRASNMQSAVAQLREAFVEAERIAPGLAQLLIADVIDMVRHTTHVDPLTRQVEPIDS